MNSKFIGITILHVSGSLSAHHQEFLPVHRHWYVLCSFDDRLLQGAGWNCSAIPSCSWFLMTVSSVRCVGYRMDVQNFFFDSQYTTTFFSPQIAHIGYGTHPVSYSLGIGRSILEVKRPKRVSEHSPPSYLLTYLLTYLLHGAESLLKS